MTRDELDSLARFLRARLGGAGAEPAFAPAPAGATAAAKRLRTVEQAVLGVEAYLELARQRPAPPGLPIEERRAHELWRTLLEMAALWPDHPDNPVARAEPNDPGGSPVTTTV